MNDQLLMDNYLLVLKSTIEVYIHGTLESSNQDIRSSLRNGLNETLDAQARTYDEMTKYGWYQISNIKASAINKTLMKIKDKNEDI